MGFFKFGTVIVNLFCTYYARTCTLSVGHIRRPLAPDAAVSHEYNVTGLEHVGHHGLHGTVAGGREGKSQGVLGLEGIPKTGLDVIHDLEWMHGKENGTWGCWK